MLLLFAKKDHASLVRDSTNPLGNITHSDMMKGMKICMCVCVLSLHMHK